MNMKTMKLESDMLLHGISKEEDDDDETYITIKNEDATVCDEIS
jgi:hypothetical protein